MAFKEVVPPKEVQGEFVQLKAVGDRLAGYFVSATKAGGQYAKPDDIAVNVLTKGADGNPVTKTISPAPYTLRRAVQHAMGEGKLVPGVQVQISKTGDQRIDGRDHPMALVKLTIDLDDANKPIIKPGVLEAMKKHAATAPPPAPKPPKPPDVFDGGGDDIPF